MIFIYQLLIHLLYLFTIPFWLLRRTDIAGEGRERLGFRLPRGPVDLWLHGASMGETKLAANLIKRLLRENPSLKIHYTMMTPTGFDFARRSFGEEVTLSFLPFDLPLLMERFFKRLKPRLVGVLEGELWPNLLLTARRRKTALILINGRMTPRSQRRYSRFRSNMEQLLGCYERFFFRSAGDRERFLELGARPERVELVGDLKFDAPPLENRDELRREYRSKLGASSDDFILVAGSTHAEDEELLICALNRLLPEYPALRVALAPRYVKRAAELQEKLQSQQIPSSIFEENSSPERTVIVDRMGLLSSLYAAADLAYVGGTMGQLGGHNLIEPIASRTPVIFGRDTANVQEAAEFLISQGAGRRVVTALELEELLIGALTSELGLAVSEDNSGENSTTARIAAYILKELR